MGGDYGRLSFDALRDFSGVLIQQGHPILDSDWNELVAIVERRMRAQAVDTFGRAIVPRETPTGFEIRIAPGPAVTIGRGRMYVDGLLAENHGDIAPDKPPTFDRSRTEAGRPASVLDEMISQEAGDFVDYGKQPYLPQPPVLPTGSGPHLAYLDVWRREVTPLKDPRLLEPALGGIDTATRWQTVWQVRLLADVGAGTTCTTDLPAWDALAAPSPARLTAGTIEYEDPDDPCLIPPGGGYRGLENQLYRVEIHSTGPLGQARFKWSRDNASVGATIEAIDDGDRLTIRRIGRDSVLRLRTGDWVEITDDRREYSGLSGDMRRIEVNEESNELRLHTPLSADLIPSNIDGDTAAARHSRIVKWDQSGSVLLSDGTPLVDLDDPASDGLIPVPADGTAVVLEAGITVSFTVASVGGSLRALDHWSFAARTETRLVDPLIAAPPIGVHHHFARLAVVSFPATVADCRTFWPLAFGAECGCTVCVSAEEHNAGTRTIQSAIDQLGDDGGTVCLAPGDFLLGLTPVVIDGKRSIRLRGHGSATSLAYVGEGAAVHVRGSDDIAIHDLAVTALNIEGPDGAPRAALLVSGGQRSRVQNCVLRVISRGGNQDLGLALNGLQLGLDIRDNVIVAPIAIGVVTGRRMAGTDADFCALLDTSVASNTLMGERRGISLDGPVIHLGPTVMVSNLIVGREAGIVATGAGLPVADGDEDRQAAWSAASVSIKANSIGFGRDGDGVISGVPDLRVQDNEITAFSRERGQRAGTCVRLVEGFMPVPVPDAQIVGNRIGNTDGAGLSIETSQAALLIKRNVIRDCGLGAITAAPAASIQTLSLADNVLERVATRTAGAPAAAVQLASIVEARIIDNIIRDVGADDADAPYTAGFSLRGIAALEIADNAISEIGPAGRRGQSVGILLDGALAAADLSANRITGSSEPDPNDPSSWSAILINSRLERRENGRHAGAAVFPAYVARGDTVYALSETGPLRFAPAREGQLRIAGNLVSDAHAGSALPLILVQADERMGACVFAENHCTLLVQGQAEAIVDLNAPRLVIANNVVRRLENDLDAMHLTCRSQGREPAATVIGNITFANIRLNGDTLPAAFHPLNIMA